MKLKAFGGGVHLFTRAAGLIWSTHAGYTVCLLVAGVLQGLAPIARLWIAKLIIDGLVAAVAEPGQSNLLDLFPLVILEFVLVTLGAVAQAGAQAIQVALAARLRARLGQAVMRVATRLDFGVLEDPTFHDRVQRAQIDAAYRPINMVMQVSLVLSGVLGFAGTLGILARLSPLASAAVVVCGLPYFYVQSRTAQMAFDAAMTQSPDARRMLYLSMLTGTLEAAKETRVFNLSKYLLDTYARLAERVQRESVRVARFQGIGGASAAVMAMLGYFGAYLYLIARVLAGELSIGDLTVYAGAFVQSQFQLQYVAIGLAGMLENHLFLRDLFELLDLDSATTERLQAPVALPTLSTNGHRATTGIVFDSVSFRYPGDGPEVLKNVSLTIPRGKVVALVGENGAGKSTLIKLLCGLYRPLSGCIRLDGRDIQVLEPEELRAQLAIVFQDFVHYHLTARENVGFGDIEALEDTSRIRGAAQRASIDSTIAALPQSYETQLGKAFEGGYELSGGEWQRLALARAYMRDAPILILDEPTASLDPRAERRVFEEVRNLLAGRTAIIISHRFSTVRLADHIYVLNEGVVAEHGSHQELVSRGGQYAELYELQAAAYR